MKKVLLLIIVGLMVFSLAGCGNTEPVEEPAETVPQISGTLEEIVEKIYTDSEIELPKTMITELNDENEAYFLGSNDVEYIRAIGSEPMMSSFAHSVVLLRVEEDADIESIEATIKENVDPRKWICVSVQEDQVIVDHVGNVVILIMSAEADALHDSFLALAE